MWLKVIKTLSKQRMYPLPIKENNGRSFMRCSGSAETGNCSAEKVVVVGVDV